MAAAGGGGKALRVVDAQLDERAHTGNGQRHNTEPRVLPYKPAAIVHVPRNVVGLTTQKLRFTIPCIKPHLIATKNVDRPGPSAPARQ